MKTAHCFLVLFVFFLSFTDLTAYDTSDATIIEDQAKIPILTPTFKERKVLKIALKNGLKAYIVSDPAVEKSSAAMVVNTGSWEDYKDYPGIAHFLEHMLFLGTKKYPVESEYDRYLSEHGGMSNAFTSAEATSYLFVVDNKAFPEALDRFSEFFSEPLFNPSGVDRELQAIDQEYAKNLENDDIREIYVLKNLGNPDHPNHAFSMGNKKSLTKVSQETLKKWYVEHYSADRMRLILISNLPLEELKKMVIEDFSSVPKRPFTPLNIDVPMFNDTVYGKMIYIEPYKNLRRLSMSWELPKKFIGMKDTKPENLLCQVLGHEGEKSLLEDLKKAKLADALSCGGSRIGNNAIILSISVELTDLGVKNVNEVILKTFQTIANLKNKGVPPYLFEESHAIDKMHYQYQQREDEFSSLMKEAIMSANEDLATYPEQSNIIQRFDPKASMEVLQYLTPEKGIFDLIAPKSLTGITPDREEPWLHIAYSVKEIPKEQMEVWKRAEAVPNIDLPATNSFIPQKLTLLPVSKTGQSNDLLPTPYAVMNDERGKVYFAQDDRYEVPQISWNVQIKTPAIDISKPETIVLGDLFVKHATDLFSKHTYPASQAGLDFDIKRTENGIALSIDGFSDKAQTLFLELIKGLNEVQPREQKFKTYKDILSRQYQDAELELPLSQASQTLKSILYKNFVTDKEKAAQIKKITFEMWEEFLANLFKSTYIEAMLYGNMTEKEAKQWVVQLKEALKSSPYPKKEQLVKEVVVLPEDKGPYYLEGKSKSQGTGVILGIEIEPFSFKMRGAQQILMQGMKQPFFSTLRTKQQTGYIVFNQPEEVERHLFNFFAVQSNSHAGRDLLARFELFIEGFMQEITKSEITKERFDNIKQTQLTTLKQPPKGMAEMGTLLNALAFNYNGDFQWLNKRIKGMEELEYDDFIDLAHLMMNKSNKRRLGVVASGPLPDDFSLMYKKAANAAQIRSVSQYTEGER